MSRPKGHQAVVLTDAPSGAARRWNRTPGRWAMSTDNMKPALVR
jgi:hypothetical protein